MARLVNRGNLLIIAFVLVLVAVSLWLRGQIRDAAPEVTDISVPHIPDFTIENFEAVAMDINGQPRQRMFAPELLHYADDKTSVVEQPHVIIYNNVTPPWQVDAKRGWISADGNTLLLKEDVVAIRERDAMHEAIRIDTTDVDVDLVKDIAVTDAEAVIVADSGVTESIGMRARFAENRLFLKERVRGLYEVPGS